jgi:hypothetical protein
VRHVIVCETQRVSGTLLCALWIQLFYRIYFRARRDTCIRGTAKVPVCVCVLSAHDHIYSFRIDKAVQLFSPFSFYFLLSFTLRERVRQSSRERFYNLKMYTQLDKMYTRAQGLAQLSRLRAPWSSLCRCACTLRSRSSHGAEGRFSSRRSLPERMRVVRGRKGGVWPVRPEASTASISSNAVCTMLCSSAHQHAGGSRGGWAIVGSGAH